MDEQKIYTDSGHGSGWGTALGAGFGGFIGSLIGNGGLFGNNGNATTAAAVSAANQGTDSLSRQILAGQQEAQLMGSINSVNSRIDGLGGQMASNMAQMQTQNGFTQLGSQIGDVATSLNSFALGMKDCCCQMKTTTLEQGYQNQLANERQTAIINQGLAGINNNIQQGNAGLGYQIQQAAANIVANDTANTQKILDWLCNSRELEQATTIQQLRDEVGRANQTNAIIAALRGTGTTATTTAAAA